MTVELSAPQARRIALRAQGLARPRPDLSARATGSAAPTPTMRGYQQVIDRVGLFQIDSINVLARAHFVPAYSRLGPYDTSLLDRASGRAPRRLVETWSHEASYVPPETYRMLAWRRRAWREHAWGSMRSAADDHPEVVAFVRDLLAHGPLTAREVQAHLEAEHPRSTGEWGWNWSLGKRALELLFLTGEVAAAGRTSSFERRYDLTSRVLPPEIAAAPEPDDATCVRTLLAIAARAHGIGSAECLLDYFRIRPRFAGSALDELVEDGTLERVRVRGWQRPLFLHRDAQVPRRATGATLLSPFDPLVWERRRLAELFGTHYRIEIYVPEHRRVHGYYALPFLVGEQIAALVDLKADRPAGVLRVLGASRPDPSQARLDSARGTFGADLPASEIAERLALELDAMARWRRLDRIEVAVDGRGALLEPLRRALAAPQPG